VRDARDVVLSEYAYEKSLGRLEGDFDDFLISFLGGNANRYGSWHSHVLSWIEADIRSIENLLIVKYEGMRRHTEATLAQILEFLKVKIDHNKIRQAIANNSLERMRVKEDLSRQCGVNEQDRFVRTGLVQGWRGRLTDEQIQLVEAQAGNGLLRLGYPIGRMPARESKETSLVPFAKQRY
jgi:hypothetical protein